MYLKKLHRFDIDCDRMYKEWLCITSSLNLSDDYMPFYSRVNVTYSSLQDENDILEYFMQATAYTIMFQERTGIPIRNIVIIMSCEDGSVKIYEKNPIDYVIPLKQAIDSYYEENKNESFISC